MCRVAAFNLFSDLGSDVMFLPALCACVCFYDFNYIFSISSVFIIIQFAFCVFFFLSYGSLSCFLQWIAWTRRAPTMASAWTESATASPAGGGCTASCPGPSAQTSVTATGPSYQTPASAAATPTGWDPTAPWVGATVAFKTRSGEFCRDMCWCGPALTQETEIYFILYRFWENNILFKAWSLKHVLKMLKFDVSILIKWSHHIFFCWLIASIFMRASVMF